MEDKFSVEFPELDDFSNFENVNEKNHNLDKIYEYLNVDQHENEIIIKKLSEFEFKIDKFLKRN